MECRHLVVSQVTNPLSFEISIKRKKGASGSAHARGRGGASFGVRLWFANRSGQGRLRLGSTSDEADQEESVGSAWGSRTAATGGGGRLSDLRTGGDGQRGGFGSEFASGEERSGSSWVVRTKKNQRAPELGKFSNAFGSRRAERISPLHRCYAREIEVTAIPCRDKICSRALLKPPKPGLGRRERETYERRSGKEIPPPVKTTVGTFIPTDGDPVGKVGGPSLNAIESPALSQTHQETHLAQESWLVLPLLEVVGGCPQTHLQSPCSNRPQELRDCTGNAVLQTGDLSQQILKSLDAKTLQIRSDRTIDVLQQNLNCMLLLQLRFTLKTKQKYALNHWGDRHTTQMPPPQTANKQSEHQCIIPSYVATYGPILSHVLPGVPYPIKNSEARRNKTSGVRLPLVLDRIIGTAAGTEGTTVSIRRIVPTVCSVSTAMEDSGFHLHTSMDNNIYNLIIVTRFPSFDTSARMRSSILNLAPSDHLSFRLLVSSIITTFVSHRGREAYHTGGYDPVVPPVAPPPDRIGATDALIRLSVLLRQSFVLKSLLCSPRVPRKEERKAGVRAVHSIIKYVTDMENVKQTSDVPLYLGTLVGQSAS
ncbi:hypothetical protein M5K25_020967 [Dendrobium thyrsiflorum]|uniref:Uncharacterized protein n=1 Tax=Dendrobium thyrsiflorum TaxID=117978 RepID=A0ABD0UC21_DENTH